MKPILVVHLFVNNVSKSTPRPGLRESPLIERIAQGEISCYPMRIATVSMTTAFSFEEQSIVPVLLHQIGVSLSVCWMYAIIGSVRDYQYMRCILVSAGQTTAWRDLQSVFEEKSILRRPCLSR